MATSTGPGQTKGSDKMSYKPTQKGDLYTWVGTPGGHTYVIEDSSDYYNVKLRELFRDEISLTCTELELLDPKKFRFDGTLSNP
jgi:hypothetical protein